MQDISRRNALILGAGLTGAMLTRRAAAQAAAQPLLTRPIPHSGERLPVVGLGTANNFGAGERADLRKVLESLVGGGAKLIDTASSYGAAEAVIGDLVAEAKLRDRVFLATKVRAEDAANGNDEFRQSRQKLRTDKVDLLQLHNVSKAGQSLGYLRDWKAQGLCRYVGVTSTFPRDFPALEAVIKREKPDFVQVNYSLGDREVEARLLPAAADAGAAVLTALPFGRSSLFRAVRGKEPPEWAKEFDAASWAQFFLKYLIGNPAVTAVIPGTTKAEHMLDNLGAGRGRLPDPAQRRAMVQLFESLN
jgi:aryl-alcohol dehydrogenase-like predicted oxidoreductase